MKSFDVKSTVAAVGLAAFLTACGDGKSLDPRAALALSSPDSLLQSVRTSTRFSQPSSKKISIATYNVENFWDDAENGSAYEDYSSKSSNWHRNNMAQAKVQRIVEVLELAGAPDVVGLQEIESANNKSRCLDLLLKEARKLGYEHAALGHQGDAVAVTSAVLSKFPITKNDHVNFPGDGSSRDPQVAEIEVHGKTLRLYVNHWKSMRGKNPGETEGERIEAARLVKEDIERARDTNPSIDVVVLGDFNSEYNQSQIYKQKSGIVDVLKSTGDARMMLGARSERLYNLWFDLPQEQRCASSFDGSRRCLDNILVSDSLFDKNALQIVPNSFRVVGRSGGGDTRMLLNADGTPLRWQVRKKGGYSEHVGVGYSDHLPLVFDAIVTTENNANAKIALQNPSTSEFGPSRLNPDVVPVCGPNDSYISLDQIDFQKASSVFDCVKEDGEDLTIQNMGHDAIVDVNGHKLVLTMTRSFGENKDYLRNVIQRSAGKHLTKVVGRIGWQNGVLAVFAHTPKDVSIGR